MARPTKYKKEYCKMMIDYFNKNDFEVVLVKDGNKQEKAIEIPARFPTIEGFAVSIGVSDDTILNWTKQFPKFLATYKICKAYQKKILIENGLRGNYNCLFAKFVAINATDMREKQEIDNNVNLKADKTILEVIADQLTNKNEVQKTNE